MSTPINRPLLWKIVNLWYIPILFPTILFMPLALLYMGVMVDKKTWKLQSLVGFFTLWGCVVLSGVSEDMKFLMWIFFTVWFIVAIFILLKSNEYLQLRDARQKGQVNPLYTTSQHSNRSQTSNSNLGEKFISDLQKWKQEIEVPKMKSHIQDLIDLSNVVMQKNSESSTRFFMRYSELINNLLGKYDEIENTRLNTADMKEAMYNVENNLGKIIEAFRNEVTSMYKNDILNMNAETAAFIQDLKNRGLIDDKIIN